MMSQEDMIRNFRRSCMDVQNRINIIVHNFAIIIDRLSLNSIQKSQWAHMSISSQIAVKGLQRLLLLKYYNVQKRGSKFILGAGYYRKYALYPKMLQMKVFEHRILYKKVSGHICLSPTRVELEAPNIGIFRNIIMFKNGEVGSLWGWMLPKIRIISKNASNKKRSRSWDLLMFSDIF